MSKGSCSTLGMVSYVLMIVGGLNWGLVGVGMLMGNGDAYNLVTMLLGTWPTVEAVVYLLVGLAAIHGLVMCASCKK